MTVAGRPVELTGIKYRMLAEHSVGVGQMLTNVHLLQRVWDLEVCNIVKRLRRKVGHEASSSTEYSRSNRATLSPAATVISRANRQVQYGSDMW